MIKQICTLFLLLALSQTLHASYLLSHPSIDIDFSGFQGQGITTTPSAGQLDSNDWRASGLSDGDTHLLGNHTSGDYARGVSNGGVRTGGLYAFDTGGGNIALGGQATGSDLSPGEIALRVLNDTGHTVDQLSLSYELYFYNDGTRSSLFGFGYSPEPGIFLDVPELTQVSQEQPDTNSQWVLSSLAFQMSDLNLSDGAFLELIWQIDDFSGVGGRDEFALDNIKITTGVPLTNVGGLPLFISGLFMLAFASTRKNAFCKGAIS